jgi:hypothetical protein
LLYHLRLQPSEIENMPFYEYEFIVQNLIDILKEKQEAEEGQSKQYADMNPNSLMKNAQKNVPKMPSMDSFKAPSFNFPSMSSLKI